MCEHNNFLWEWNGNSITGVVQQITYTKGFQTCEKLLKWIIVYKCQSNNGFHGLNQEHRQAG